MSHPFGDLVSQHLHRKHGLSQSKLAAGILQDPSIVGKMCKGERLTGPQARERVLQIIDWLRQQGVLETVTEANDLLAAAGMSALQEGAQTERTMLRQLRSQPPTERGAAGEPVHGPVRLPVASAPRTNLPTPLTSFVGRTHELVEVAQSIMDHRLVTLTGVGGVGKTRIAIEAARRMLELDHSHSLTFPDGVWFVALEAVDSPERMVSTIADAVQCPPPGAADVRDHLLSYLQPRHLLLVLDNFEHLRDWADLLIAILTVAPLVKLLVTSREALNLEQEWRYPLDGLSLVAGDDAEEAAQSSAARLFVERARRVFPAFDLAVEREAVEHICRLVEGMPLAIELAATWTRVLPCHVIADEIVRDLAFLTNDMRNVSDRHRSMRAVFDRSWELLSQEERHVLARLSVFQGGFQRQAAELVAGATLPILTALVDKSLLRWEPGDRYRMHELLRQYAAERLEQSPGEAADAHERHCTTYADFLDRRAADLSGLRQRLALAEIAIDLENVRAAWHYALYHLRMSELQRAAYPFYMFHDCGTRYREGADLFEQATQQLDRLLGNRPPTMEVGPALAELLHYLGWLLIHTGELQHARAALERSQAILTRLGISPRPGLGTDPLVALGTLANISGDYGEAARLGEAARRRSEAQGDLGNLMVACYVLTNAAFARGRYAEAKRYGERAYELAAQQNDRWFIAYVVADLGNIARATGDYAEAARQYQIGYAIREEFGDPEGLALALVHLGQVSLLQSEPERACVQFERSRALYHDIGDRGGEATALHGLGMTAIAAGDYAVAAQYLHSALEIAAAIGYTSRVHSILADVAELFLLIEEPLRAVGLLVPILRDPASDRETSDHARSLLSRCAAALAPEQYAAVTHGTQAIDLPAVLSVLQRASRGAAISPAAVAGVASLPVPRHRLPPTAQTTQPPMEPLTERELAVLQLIAEGQSNQEIAAHLVIAPGTAKWYVSQIFGKLGVHSRTQAIVHARELGYLA
jgi:predicted ATPase/DNA-binding CsgD family transcriptional regulator